MPLLPRQINVYLSSFPSITLTVTQKTKHCSLMINDLHGTGLQRWYQKIRQVTEEKGSPEKGSLLCDEHCSVSYFRIKVLVMYFTFFYLSAHSVVGSSPKYFNVCSFDLFISEGIEE